MTVGGGQLAVGGGPLAVGRDWLEFTEVRDLFLERGVPEAAIKLGDVRLQLCDLAVLQMRHREWQLKHEYLAELELTFDCDHRTQSLSALIKESWALYYRHEDMRCQGPAVFELWLRGHAVMAAIVATEPETGCDLFLFEANLKGPWIERGLEHFSVSNALLVR